MELINRVARIRRELILDTGDEPSPQELAEKAEISVERLAELGACTKEPVSLDISLSEDGDTEFGDLIMDSDSPSPWETVTFGLLQHTLRSILAELTPREAGIISLRDYLGDE